MSVFKATQQEEVELTLWATDDEVDEFVRGANDQHLICRERGRHDWQAIRTTGLVFTGITKDDYPERRTACPICRAVERVEVWDVKFTQQRRGQGQTLRAAHCYTHYIDDATRTQMHAGRMQPRQIRGAVGRWR